jgi:hypothetical protein
MVENTHLSSDGLCFHAVKSLGVTGSLGKIYAIDMQTVDYAP